MRYIVHDKTITCRADSVAPMREEFYNLRVMILTPSDSHKDNGKWNDETVVSFYLLGESPVYGDNLEEAEHDGAEITIRLDQLLAALVASYPSVVNAWGDVMMQSLRSAQGE